MNVSVVEIKTITYTFTKVEQDYLVKMGIWHLIRDRLFSNERIQVEQG